MKKLKSQACRPKVVRVPIRVPWADCKRGAALGAIIGGIAGGGKGAAIGAGVGAGAGTGVQAATKGQQIKLPSETVLNFRLESALKVTPASASGRNAGRQRVDQ